MWQQRLDDILSAPFELLRLEPGGSPPYRGRYLRLGDDLLALGPMIAQGAEAMVFELIHLERGELVGVAKICRYSPGSEEYRAWAVPYRLERNPSSSVPEIELRPARLLEVPGGLIKLQEYVPADPSVDWATPYPAWPIFETQRERGAEEALQQAAELIEQHGPHGILLEAQGLILIALGRWEEARAVLEQALEAFAAESRSGVLRTGLLLARIHRRNYDANRWTDSAAVVRLKVPGGPTVSQVIYTDAEAGAREDTLEDRALYVLLEILSQEPCFIPALLLLAEELSNSQITWRHSLEVLDAIERIDPAREDAREFRRNLEEGHQRYLDHLASIAVAPERSGQTDESQREIDEDSTVAPGDGSEPTPSVPPGSYLQDFERAYRPEPARGQIAEARYQSAWANLAHGRTEQAENAARAAMELDPHNVVYALGLARLLDLTGQHARAGEVLEKALERFPDEPGVFVALGEFHLERQDAEKALVAFLRAARLELASRWRIDLGLGQAYRRLGKRDKALEHLRMAYEEAPDTDPSERFRRRLAWKAFAAEQLIYALRDERHGATEDDLEEALRIVDEALARYPDEPDLLVCRAQSLCIAQRIEEAVTVLEQAVALSPDHPIAAEFLKSLRESSEA